MLHYPSNIIKYFADDNAETFTSNKILIVDDNRDCCNIFVIFN